MLSQHQQLQEESCRMICGLQDSYGHSQRPSTLIFPIDNNNTILSIIVEYLWLSLASLQRENPVIVWG